MSKATSRGLLTLVAINGAARVLRQLFSRVDMKALCDEMRDYSEHSINTWGETGDGNKNTVWIAGVFTEWIEECFPENDKHKAAVLVAACGMMIDDQMAKIRDKKKLRHLYKLSGMVATMQDFTDANWLNFPALDAAKRCADRMEEIAQENEDVTFKVARPIELKIQPEIRSYGGILKGISRLSA